MLALFLFLKLVVPFCCHLSQSTLASHLTQETICISATATHQQKESSRKLLLYTVKTQHFVCWVGMEYTCNNCMCYVEREKIKRTHMQYVSCIGIHSTKSFIEPSWMQLHLHHTVLTILLKKKLLWICQVWWLPLLDIFKSCSEANLDWGIEFTGIFKIFNIFIWNHCSVYASSCLWPMFCWMVNLQCTQFVHRI